MFQHTLFNFKMKIPFFPTRTITIKTPLSEAQAFKRLEAGINPSKINYLNLAEDTFRGEIKPPTFTIHEVVPPRTNSFIPVLKGIIRQEGGQTLVTVKMQLGGCIIAFAVAWCYVPCLMFFLNIKSWISGEAFSLSIFLVAVGALSVMGLMMNYGFRNGETAAKAFLLKTFGGELV